MIYFYGRSPPSSNVDPTMGPTPGPTLVLRGGRTPPVGVNYFTFCTMAEFSASSVVKTSPDCMNVFSLLSVDIMNFLNFQLVVSALPS